MTTIKSSLLTILITISLFCPTIRAQQYLPPNTPVTKAQYDQASPAVAVDPVNPYHLVVTWDDFTPYLPYPQYNYATPGFSFSTDGGNSWAAGRQIQSPGGHNFGFNTSCAIDRHGHEYCMFTTRDADVPPPLQVDINVSTDGGNTWPHWYPVSPLTTGQDKPYMAVDNTGGNYDGTIYAAWTDFSNGSSILVSHSTDYGVDWSTPANLFHVQATSTPGSFSDPLPGVQPPSPYDPFVQDAIPAVGPDGSVYVVFFSSDGAPVGHPIPGSIKFAKSTTPGGSTFTTPVDIVTLDETVYNLKIGNLYVSTKPTIAVDPASGYVYVAFTNNDDSAYDIIFLRSTDQGESWTLSSPTQPSSGEQFFPWLSVSSSGTLSLVYCQAPQNSVYVDVYVAESYNSGYSFYGSDIRVTPNSFDASASTWGSEYNGMVSTPFKNVFPV